MAPVAGLNAAGPTAEPFPAPGFTKLAASVSPDTENVAGIQCGLQNTFFCVVGMQDIAVHLLLWRGYLGTYLTTGPLKSLLK